MNEKWIEKTIAAIEQDGFDTKILPITIFVREDVTNVEQAVADACKEYCLTKAGMQMLRNNSNQFNWGDFDCFVPNAICEKYGILKKENDHVGNIVIAYDRQLVDAQELFSMDESDIALEVHKRFENAMEEQVDELDFYMELLEIGATVALVRWYEGDEKADHMQRFCEEHGLL